MKILKILVFSILGILLTFLIVLFRLDYQHNPIDDESTGFKNNLFQNKNIKFNMECHEDLIGLNMHSNYFDFFQYSIDGSVILNGIDDRYPNLKNFFPNNSNVQNVSSIKWTKTPFIRNEKLMYVYDILNSSNVRNANCAKEFNFQKILSSKGAYYSVYTCFPKGVFIFVYLPIGEKLFIIHKR